MALVTHHRIAQVLRCLIISIVLLKSISSSAQIDSSFSAKSLIIPSALMTTALIINHENIKTSFQENIREQYPNFRNNADDYFQYLPSVMDFVFSITDEKENNVKHLSDMLISELAMIATTQLLKRTLDAKRPNGGGLSFPSGHTAQAFTGATVFYHHYRKERPFLAATGFVVASATGAFRVLRNKHWISDVTFSAGLGIIIGTLTYNFNPIGRDKMTEHVQIAAYPDRISLNLYF